jgi:Zn-dependent peptidase ImmA (M78 family)
MQTSELYQLAESHGHEVVSMPLRESRALAFEDDSHICHVAISDRLEGVQEKIELAHELGHCEYSGFYNYHSPFELRSRCEARANRWSYLHLIPFDQLKETVEHGCESVWQIAEHFDVPEEYAVKALQFYIEQLGKRLE